MTNHPRLVPHWSLLLIALVSAVLIFTNLGADYLWADEGDTAVLACNILKFGVPKAWDGISFTDSDYGDRENQNLVMVTTPWVQYYAAAMSILMLGKSSFAARLPFALAGWLTILLGWRIVRQINGDWRPAFCAAALIACSVQFLLYARQARYYALSMFFACWLICIFLQMKSARQCTLFAVVAILLFHTHPFASAVWISLGLLSLIYRPFFPRRRWFLFAFVPILVFTLPWFEVARTGYLPMMTLPDGPGDFLARTIQYLLEVASVTSLVGIILLLVVVAGLVKLRKPSPGDSSESPRDAFFKCEEKGFLLIVLLTVLFCALSIAVTQEPDSLRIIGTRYTAAVIPLLEMVAGILIFKISRGKTAIWVSLAILAIFTRLDQIGPWIWWNPSGLFSVGKYSVATHVSSSAINRIVDMGLVRFICNLWRMNPGTMGRSVEVLRRLAQPGDVVVTNYEFEPLYFHTGLPQGLTIIPESPIYQTARQLGLPDYVFSLQNARWIVWRFAWEGSAGLSWAQIEKDLRARGAQITEVTRLKETFWQNRENVHFAHFCGGKHLFGGHHQHHAFPRTRIYRIDYPQGTRGPPRPDRRLH